MGGEVAMYGKSNMETCIIICKIDSQREFAVWLRKLKQGLSSNLERWECVRGGREIPEQEDIGTPMVNSCGCMTNQTNIVKQ